MSICWSCLRVRRAFGILEESPEASQEREQLFVQMCRTNYGLMGALIGGFHSIDAQSLKDLWQDLGRGKLLRAIAVAIKFVDPSNQATLDISANDIYLIGQYLDGTVMGLAIRDFYVGLIERYCPEFLEEFRYLLERNMFLSAQFCDLALIITGMWLSRKWPGHSPSLVVWVGR